MHKAVKKMDFFAIDKIDGLLYNVQKEVTEMNAWHSEEHIDQTDFPQTRHIQVNSCGSERVLKTDYTILRSKGRKDFHFLYLRSGWLHGEIDHLPFRLEKGQCIVFLPGVPQMYTFSKEGDPVSLYLHFTGDAAAQEMEFVQQNGTGIYTISETTAFENLMLRLNRVHNLRTPLYIPEENSLLLQLIALLAKDSLPPSDAGRDDIWRAMEYLQIHMQEELDLEEYAEQLHLSYSRFSHLFSATAGVSPHQYLLKLRLERARDLLKDSSMNICQISETVGFSDPYYFSRIFKKKFSVSPREFRKSGYASKK